MEAKTILDKMYSLCDPGLTAARDGDLEILKKLGKHFTSILYIYIINDLCVFIHHKI